jgi:hypothetical protein
MKLALAVAILAVAACKSRPPCEGLFQTWRGAAGQAAEVQHGWFLDRCEKADPRVTQCREELIAQAGSGSPQLAISWGMPGCVQKYRTLRARDEHVADAVMAQVRAGALAPGRALLPPALESASLDSSVWIGRRPDGRTWLWFPTWHGRDRNVAGYLWSSAPFVPADTHPGTPPTMTIPGFCFDDACTQPPEPEPFTVEQQLDDHLRFVRWSWD